MRLYRLVSGANGFALALSDESAPHPGPREVLVRMEAASLNYRDLLMLDGRFPAAHHGLIPLSDGAGRVEAVGPEVTRWQPGDRVVGLFFQDWTAGRFEQRYFASALGGDRDGVLAEYVAFPQDGLVAVPETLSMIEAATLPCAAVTAWHALFPRGGIVSGDTLVVQGTGGVALFALQFATAAGARVIVLSSSDEKRERAERLGAWKTLNYRRDPGWEEKVLALTDGRGASHIIDLGGTDTFDRSLAAVAAGGKIARVGHLTGFGLRPDLSALHRKNVDILGVAVGSGEHFAAMNAFIAQHGIHPAVDRVFDFDSAFDACDFLRSGRHFGKVVICIRCDVGESLHRLGHK